MRLVSPNGSSFGLTILGYQYPQTTDQYYDSNWLVIQVDVVHPRGAWSVKEHCLLTFEISRLAQWLEEVQADTNSSSVCGFTEPHLLLEIEKSDKGTRILRIYFELQLRPPWAYSRRAGQENLWVEFPCEDIDLQVAANDLRLELQQYPQRVFRNWPYSTNRSDSALVVVLPNNSIKLTC